MMLSARANRISANSGTVALLEFLLAATGAGIVAADGLQWIAHRFLRAMVAMRAMHVVVLMLMLMLMLMVVIAMRTVDMGLLRHGGTTPECGREE